MRDRVLRRSYALLGKRAYSQGGNNTGGASFGSWSAWVQAIASTPSPMALVAVHYLISGNQGDTQFQIGIGAAAAEVAIYTGSGAAKAGREDLREPIFIPAGTRVAHRGAGGGSSNGVNLLLELVPIGSPAAAAALGVDRSGFAVNHHPLLAASAGAPVANTVVDTYGAWGQLWPANTYAFPVELVAMHCGTGVIGAGADEYVMQFGVGGAGSEVALGDEFRAWGFSEMTWGHLPAGRLIVPTNARLAARCKNVTDATQGSVPVRGIQSRRVL